MRHQSHPDYLRQTFPISIQNKRKTFSATITYDAPSILQDTGSNISIEVAKGTRAVIKQHIHTNLEPLGFVTSRNECIVSPVVTVQTMEIISDQDAALMHRKKETDNDQPMELEPVSIILPRKLEDQPMKPKHSYLEESQSDEDQSAMVESLHPGRAGHTDQNPPMKLEEEGKQKMKSEPEEARDAHGGQPIKHEPVSPKEVRDSDDDESMKLEIVSPKEKLEPLSVDEAKAHSSSMYQTVHNGMKVEQTDFQEGHSSHRYTEVPKNVMHEDVDEETFYKFKLTIPHYVDQENLLPLIQVKWGNMQDKLREIRKGKPDKFEPYCEVYNDHVVVYADHFCDVVCTCPEKVCASKLLAFPFGQIYSERGGYETHMKVKTYLCSHLYQDKSLKKVSITVKFFTF